MIRNMLEKFSYLETDESVENYYYPINRFNGFSV